jgi:hypothetical protein
MLGTVHLTTFLPSETFYNYAGRRSAMNQTSCITLPPKHTTRSTHQSCFYEDHPEKVPAKGCYSSDGEDNEE